MNKSGEIIWGKTHIFSLERFAVAPNSDISAYTLEVLFEGISVLGPQGVFPLQQLSCMAHSCRVKTQESTIHSTHPELIWKQLMSRGEEARQQTLRGCSIRMIKGPPGEVYSPQVFDSASGTAPRRNCMVIFRKIQKPGPK